jgi:hypothetical protein
LRNSSSTVSVRSNFSVPFDIAEQASGDYLSNAVVGSIAVALIVSIALIIYFLMKRNSFVSDI